MECQIRVAAERDKRRQEERQYVQELDMDTDYSEGEYQDTDYTIPAEQEPEEYQHTGDTPPWATYLEQRVNQGFNTLNTQIAELADRMDRAGIPQVPLEEQGRRRVRRWDTGGASSSRG